MAMEVTKRETLDVALYEQLHGQFVQFVSALESGRIEDPVAVTWAGSSDQPIDTALDREWLERTRREADNSLQKLEVELKGYQTNLIKESIRVLGLAATLVPERLTKKARRWGSGTWRACSSAVAT